MSTISVTSSCYNDNPAMHGECWQQNGYGWCQCTCHDAGHVIASKEVQIERAFAALAIVREDPRTTKEHHRHLDELENWLEHQRDTAVILVAI